MFFILVGYVQNDDRPKIFGRSMDEYWAFLLENLDLWVDNEGCIAAVLPTELTAVTSSSPLECQYLEIHGNLQNIYQL